MMKPKNITGIILAGGKSSRMGTNKALLHYRGKSFIQHAIEVMKPLVDRVIIVGDPENYPDLDLQIVQDIYRNAGPVAGIHAGLEFSETPFNIVLSCDVPLLNEQILKELIEGIDGNNDVVLIECKGQRHPLIAVYKTTCRHLFDDLLRSGEKRLLSVLDLLKVKIVHLSNDKAHCVANINHPSTLKKLLHEVND
jgi:molybdopterin-guanine dinucleotide biosynthesis protein A